MRECYRCRSTKTYVSKEGHELWRSNKEVKNKWLCRKCYDKYIGHPKWNPITNLKWNFRHINFTPLGKQILLKRDPRIGVCNFCRAVRGIDCKQTQMHHDEDKYDINNPLRYAMEICAKCHVKSRTDV